MHLTGVFIEFSELRDNFSAKRLFELETSCVRDQDVITEMQVRERMFKMTPIHTSVI